MIPVFAKGIKLFVDGASERTNLTESRCSASLPERAYEPFKTKTSNVICKRGKQ
jgi:hypothetical protein